MTILVRRAVLTAAHAAKRVAQRHPTLALVATAVTARERFQPTITNLISARISSPVPFAGQMCVLENHQRLNNSKMKTETLAVRTTAPAQFVRPNKGLPLTFLVIGEGVSMAGEDIWMVMEYGFKKTFGALKRDVHPITPSALMLEQLNGWLRMIDFTPSEQTLQLWGKINDGIQLSKELRDIHTKPRSEISKFCVEQSRFTDALYFK